MLGGLIDSLTHLLLTSELNWLLRTNLLEQEYVPSITTLLNAEEGRVYLDVARPRVCIRGPEEREQSDLGYRWLGDDEVSP